MTYRLAADIGGTFTDIAILSSDGALLTAKVPSTPDDYARGILEGCRQLLAAQDLDPASIGEILHASTVATNAILELKGAKTALVTTAGFRDVLELRRIRVPRLYEPLYQKPQPLALRRHRYEVRERVGPRGEVLLPLAEEDVIAAAGAIAATDIEAVAVCFLHSYANAEHEKRTGAILRERLPGRFITLSAEVLPEIREYERTSTTVINAYVGPPVRRYLGSLTAKLTEAGLSAPLRMMQSSGGILDIASVMVKPAQVVESGPAAGVIGAAYLGTRSGYADIITLDMGGTTAKAAVIEKGRHLSTDEYEVGGGISLSSRLVKGGGYALKLPVIDVSEVGAGGGSIVWRDPAGLLKVGPQSAGASPGPACYGKGGAAPTVTDANVVLGYLNPAALAGGTVPIDADAARRAIASVKDDGRDIHDTAYGIVQLATATMMRAVKAVTTYRGRDPGDFTLFAFGGGGGLHAAGLARALRIGRVVVPPAAGVFSALGLLFANVETGRSLALLRHTDAADPAEMEVVYRRLEQDVMAELGVASTTAAVLRRRADLRYAGQAFELTLDLPEGPLSRESLNRLADAFEVEHEATYGHRLAAGHRCEIVTLRVMGTIPKKHPASLDIERLFAARPRAVAAGRRVYFGPDGMHDAPVLGRADLTPEPRQGPMIIEEYEATTVVPPHATAHRDGSGNIVIDLARPA